MVCSSLFWIAPRSERCLDTDARAALIIVIAFCALALSVPETDTPLIPIEESYQNLQIGAKIGWGISAGSRLRLTPQVGAGLLAVSASESEGYAIKGSVGVRADYRLSKSFALVVAPEYGLALSKSNVYDDLSAVSSKIKGWANGFNCLIGVHFSF